MAWEWIGTSAVGGLGIFFTWLTDKQSRDQALQTLREQLGHERLQAREAREQERLETAYVALLKMAERVGHWAQMVHPVAQSGELPATPLPSLEMQADTAALVNAYGTAAVRQRMETWEAVVRQMITQAELVDWEERDPPKAGDPRLERPYTNSPRGALDRLRPQEAETRRAFEDQVRVELSSLYRSSAEPSSVTRSYTYESGKLTERGESAALEDAPHAPDDRQPERTPGTPERSTPRPSQ